MAENNQYGKADESQNVIYGFVPDIKVYDNYVKVYYCGYKLDVPQWRLNELLEELQLVGKGKKQKGKTVFIDARKMGHMVDRKHRDFTEEDIQKLANTFEAFQNGTLEDEKGFCSVATIQDIAKQDYVLTPGRYVGIEEQVDDGEPFEEKMTRLTSELSDMFERSHELEDEIRRKLGAIGYEV